MRWYTCSRMCNAREWVWPEQGRRYNGRPLLARYANIPSNTHQPRIDKLLRYNGLDGQVYGVYIGAKDEWVGDNELLYL